MYVQYYPLSEDSLHIALTPKVHNTLAANLIFFSESTAHSNFYWELIHNEYIYV